MGFLIAGIVSILASVAIGLAASKGWLQPFDLPIMRAGAMVEGVTPQWGIASARFVTHLGDPGIRTGLIIIAALILVARESWRAAAIYVAAVVVTIASYSWAKQAFDRPRPKLTEWLSTPTDPSFPSGHSAGAVVVLVLAAALIGGRGLVPAMTAGAIAIGCSRVAMGVHWPSDVIGGWLFGAGGAMIGYAAVQRWGNHGAPLF